MRDDFDYKENEDFEYTQGENFVMRDTKEEDDKEVIVETQPMNPEIIEQDHVEQEQTEIIQQVEVIQEEEKEPMVERKAATYDYSGNYAHRNPKKPKKKNRFTSVIASAAVFGLVAGVVFQGVNITADRFTGNTGDATTQAQIESTKTSSGAPAAQADGDISTIAENVMPSIVTITSTVSQTSYGFFNEPYSNESQGSGSGIIVGKNDKELLVLTNNHVVDGATKLQVGFIDGKVVDATIKGTDADEDLAVIAIPVSEIDADTLAQIKVAVLNNEDSLKVGQQVVAIGNALGYGQSVTVGYVSALEREVQLEDKTLTLLQTDAAINPGNSGGALLNTAGEVIGINTAKYNSSLAEGMGYAIPVSKASDIIDQLMNQEQIPETKQAFLGIMGSTVTSEYVERFNMPQGVFVSQISEGSPAESGGIRAHDVIVEFNGRKVSTMEGLQNLISQKAAGSQVEMKVMRLGQDGEYEEVVLQVTLQAKSESAQ